jgi:predicted HAD superfamily Cof-like phosphohydrolase
MQKTFIGGEMNNEQKLVSDWMQKFGQECKEKPGLPDLGVRILRAKLILEEAFETINALGFLVADKHDCEIRLNDAGFIPTGFPNLEAIADGCADLRVVTIGTEVACGIDGEATFNEVMRSNESKLWTHDEIHSEDFMEGYSSEWVDSPVEREYVVKDKDGKVIKSPSYSPANLTPILNQR